MMRNFLVMVLSMFFFWGNAFAGDFTWENMMMAAVKLQPDFDYGKYAEAYMRKFRPDVWSRYHDDEFEFQEKLEETKKIFEERVKNHSLDEVYTIYTTFQFGKYDFGAGSFPLDALKRGSYFYAEETVWAPFPPWYKVFFDNPEKIGDLKMEKKEAKSFLDSKKIYGNVDRTVYATIHFHIVKLKKKPDELLAHIDDAIVYADMNRSKVLQKF